MKLTWHGTAALEIESEGTKILFDPFVPIRGTEFELTIDEYDGFDEIFVTHGHLDHAVDIPEVCRRNPNAKVHCSNVPYNTLINHGVPESQLVKYEFGDSIEVGGIKLTMLRGKHAQLPADFYEPDLSVLPDFMAENLKWINETHPQFPEGDETTFYYIEAEGKAVSVMGSMNLRDDTYYPTGSDLLVLPYNGWGNDNFTPAVRVVEKLKPKKIILDHFDVTFPPIVAYVERGPILEKYKGMISEFEHRVPVEI